MTCLRVIISFVAGVAQLVEQLSCKQQVTSSSLVAGSSDTPYRYGMVFFCLFEGKHVSIVNSREMCTL